jgi:hypothetical protein
MREKITREALLSAEIEGPFRVAGEDRFRAEKLFEIRLTGREDCPDLVLSGPDGGAIRVVDEDGTELGEEEVQVLLWERLEGFDEVIERLTGPLPAP